MTQIKTVIESNFLDIFARECPGKPIPELSADLVLLDSGLDSMGFAILVVELEENLGFDPFTLAEEAYYPSTLGAFVEFYEKHKP